MQEKLIQEFQNGNKRAGDDFYNANINLVKYAVKKYKLVSMDGEETVALVNQAFAKSMQAFDPSKGKFTTYFMLSARGHILRHFRDFANIIKSHREDHANNKVIPCDSLDKVLYTGESVDICLRDIVGAEDDQSQVIVNEALDKVNEIDRNIFILYHLEGYSQQEIGDIYGFSQVSVSRHIKKAKNSLKVALKEVC